MREHDKLLHMWLDEDQLHKYKAQLKMYKEKSGAFQPSVLWSQKALSVDACQWWDDWGSGEKEIHDFAHNTCSQTTSIGEAERFWKAYANIHNAN